MIDICSQSRSLGFSETPIAAHTYALDAQELRSKMDLKIRKHLLAILAE